MTLDRRRRTLVAATAAAVLVPPARAAADDIVVGQIGPFTGMPAPDAVELRQGIQAAFAQINANGGIGGRRLSLFELDDGYKEDGFVRQFDEAMKRKPVALLSPVGTRAVQRMLDERLLDRNDMVVINAVPGADSLRKPGHPRLFHVRAGDRQQIERIVGHAVALGITQMAVLAQDVPIGRSGLAAATEVAGRLRLTLTPVTVPADASTLTQEASRIASGAAQCTLMLGSPRFAADGVVALRNAGMSRSVYVLSYVSPSMLRQAGTAAVRGVALAQVFPNPNGARLPLQHEFRAAMGRAGATGRYTAFNLEGYVTARVLAEALRRTKDVTPAGVARALKAMGDVSVGGYHVNFARENLGSSFVDIAITNDEGRLLY